MAKFIGNLKNIIDFDSLVLNLSPGHLEENCIFDDSGKLKEECKNDIRFINLAKANYRDPLCNGHIYTAQHHFPVDVVYKLDNYFGTACVRMLISEFMPGHIVPPHFDYLREGKPEAEKTLLEYGEIAAYHIHLGNPEEGHVFLINNHCHYLEECGNCYQWDDYLNWHSACNTGFHKKYLLTYAGIKLKDKNVKYKYQFYQDTEQVNIIFQDGRVI